MLEEIDAYLDEGISALRSNRVTEAILTLTKAHGVVSVLLDQASRWERIRKGYEAGIRPKELSLRYGLSAGHISVKASQEHWLNPSKLAKVASIRKNKNVFHLVCTGCEHYFEAYSGHAKVCDQCRALENMGRQA